MKVTNVFADFETCVIIKDYFYEYPEGDPDKFQIIKNVGEVFP